MVFGEWFIGVLPPSPLPVFLKVRILKGFKSCVLEVRILQELWARFAEVRILKGIVAGSEWRGVRSRKEKIPSCSEQPVAKSE